LLAPLEALRILQYIYHTLHMQTSFRYLVLIIFLTCSSFIYVSGQAAIYSSDASHHPIVAQNGMVASQHHLATQAGLEILQDGGNAVDAAVAVGFALAVVLPRAGNLGGGGFMMVYDAKTGKTRAINYREMAPLLAHRDMYLDEEGNVDRVKLNFTHQSAGVPGTVAGLAHALETYGTMTLKEVMKPAIRLAEKGFAVTYDLSSILQRYESRMKASPETEKIFYKGQGYYQPGEILKQKDLTWSLKRISKKGPDAFYKGEIAERLVADQQANDGLISMEDLATYEVEDTEPVSGTYRGHEIVSMPPPSSGGVHIIQMLNILEEFPIGYLGHNTAETIHLMAEAMKFAYADRSEHLGDPNFWEVPTEWITSKTYADSLRSRIDRWKAAPSEEIKPGKPKDYESDETTHFTVVDKAGNMVVNTYTLTGTGILLNNEMSDLSAKPGVANAFGLLGGEANAVAPRKRPLSSMTPTIVLKEGKPYFATGSPGGSRIITTVLQIIMNIIDHEMNVAEASHAVRIHHQWYPEVLYVEKTLNNDTQALLRAKQHDVQYRAAMGSTQTIMFKDGLIWGASDPRRPDGETLGY